ncbi:hypothetical protein IE81DRAFT_112530 [Ceraceosorus guamensis]|uniref:Uncharacterized protein n=1 Tax=Ceraceosorus guamensis TaxID=1522189 RepID=A0A316W1C1_9BASI|nr:hypothetical protein IE81DRAFT_112530 [Ceraceosorus guamensis]PWN42918.1 hypothetical protein IE81DRAFT_112530 [Ceraceosorus guamensis]
MSTQRMQRVRSRAAGSLDELALHLEKRQGALTGVTSGLESGANKAGDKASSYTSGLNQWEILAVAAAGVALIALVCTWTWLVCNRKRKAREAAKAKEEEEIAAAEKLRRTNTMTQSSHGHHGSKESQSQRKSLLANAAPAGMAREDLRVNTASAAKMGQDLHSPRSPGPRDPFLPPSPKGHQAQLAHSNISSAAFHASAATPYAQHHEGPSYGMEATSPNSRRSYHQVVYPDQPLPQSVDLREPLPLAISRSPPRSSHVPLPRAPAPQYGYQGGMSNPYAEEHTSAHEPISAYGAQPAEGYGMPMPQYQRPMSYGQPSNRMSHYGAAL